MTFKETKNRSNLSYTVSVRDKELFRDASVSTKMIKNKWKIKLTGEKNLLENCDKSCDRQKSSVTRGKYEINIVILKRCGD